MSVNVQVPRLLQDSQPVIFLVFQAWKNEATSEIIQPLSTHLVPTLVSCPIQDSETWRTEACAWYSDQMLKWWMMQSIDWWNRDSRTCYNMLQQRPTQEARHLIEVGSWISWMCWFFDYTALLAFRLVSSRCKRHTNGCLLLRSHCHEIFSKAIQDVRIEYPKDAVISHDIEIINVSHSIRMSVLQIWPRLEELLPAQEAIEADQARNAQGQMSQMVKPSKNQGQDGTSAIECHAGADGLGSCAGTFEFQSELYTHMAAMAEQIIAQPASCRQNKLVHQMPPWTCRCDFMANSLLGEIQWSWFLQKLSKTMQKTPDCSKVWRFHWTETHHTKEHQDEKGHRNTMLPWKATHLYFYFSSIT